MYKRRRTRIRHPFRLFVICLIPIIAIVSVVLISGNRNSEPAFNESTGTVRPDGSTPGNSGNESTITPNSTGTPANTSAVNTPKPSPISYSVIIDAGHGGFDVGTEGSGSYKNEDALNLEIALELKKCLNNTSVTPLMTRTDNKALAGTKDEDMQERARLIKQSNAGLMVSIHMNSFSDSSVAGPQVFYDAGSEDSRIFASLMQDKLNAASGKSRSSQPQDLFVLRESPMPAILIECGFLTNPKEEKNLNSSKYQKKLAKAISDCIVDYLRAA